MEDDSFWKTRLETLLNRIKGIMHHVLGSGVVQQRSCFTDFVLRLIPYDVRYEQTEMDAGDGSDDKKKSYATPLYARQLS